MSASETTVDPKVWIGSLSAYNAGNLVGEWVDATDLKAMEEVAAELPGEEFALFDREGFGDLIGEYTPLETVAKIATALEEHGEPFRLYVENQGYSLGPEDVDSCVGDFEEAYQGEWGGLMTSPMVDFAQNLAEDIGAIDEDAAWPNNCIDWERAARELEGDYWEQGGHVFRSV